MHHQELDLLLSDSIRLGREVYSAAIPADYNRWRQRDTSLMTLLSNVTAFTNSTPFSVIFRNASGQNMAAMMTFKREVYLRIKLKPTAHVSVYF